MEGYMLYRKEGRTAVVLTCEDDDELFYLVSKLHRTRDKMLKAFAAELLEDYFEKVNGEEPEPPVREVQTSRVKT